ncbi:M48 family metallopeptidase [Marinimicrobium sp. C6131]|uniref:M48 family metallopeptidase n=1 Tax=Marinimicrobium sp. C6131 TaxID=3022676 RepID=UPI00223E6B57|nr:M48 family metallopeptidase [Marinimicrobium sp. C6131]UZJ44087.1 M48 family metallopeptidase [Marinimicrobium sp. C6131]
MGYQNRQPPEGINYEPQGWQRDFILLVLGFAAGLALLTWLVILVLGWSARWIPFSWEQSLSASLNEQREPTERTGYLQTLADDLARAGGLNPELSLVVHHQAQDTVNAFATLGGHIIVLDGLLEKVESEQGLAFVLAHEIAHIHYRHPLQNAARQAGLGLISALVFGRSDLNWIAGSGGQLAMLDYSRDMEREADAWALQALYNHYGHVAGADSLFRWLAEQQQAGALPEWLSTHPDTGARLERLEQLSTALGYPTDGPLTTIPSVTR